MHGSFYTQISDMQDLIAALKELSISGKTEANRKLLYHGRGVLRDIHNVFIDYNSSLLPIVFMHTDCIRPPEM